jgi:hypothetical protein
MWRIDKLDGHGETAWAWYSRLPKFMKWEYQNDDKDEFIASFEQGVNFGGWNGDLEVIVHGEDKGETLEGHLFCDPKADIHLLAATISYGVKNVDRRVLIETPSRHKTLRNILTQIGFHDLGLFAYRGRNVETSHYLYGQEKN